MSPLHRPARRVSPVSAFLLAGTLCAVATSLAARDLRAGALTLLDPVLPPTPPGASSAAGYLAVVNGGDEDDRLLGGSAAFASGVELHRTTVEDDVARMRRLDGGLAVPAGATVRLDPGATHLMFVGLAETLPDGERRPVTLLFERAGPVVVEFAIERPGGVGRTTAPADRNAMDHGETDHGETDHDVRQ